MRVRYPLRTAVMFVIAFVFASESQARLQYRTVFKKVYSKHSKACKASCLICHVKKKNKKPDNKRLNDYGKKLKKELGEKNVKDKEKVKDALKKIGPPSVCRDTDHTLALDRDETEIAFGSQAKAWKRERDTAAEFIQRVLIPR